MINGCVFTSLEDFEAFQRATVGAITISRAAVIPALNLALNISSADLSVVQDVETHL